MKYGLSFVSILYVGMFYLDIKFVKEIGRISGKIKIYRGI